MVYLSSNRRITKVRRLISGDGQLVEDCREKIHCSYPDDISQDIQRNSRNLKRRIIRFEGKILVLTKIEDDKIDLGCLFQVSKCETRNVKEDKN